MENNIKAEDVIHLYLGCEVQVPTTMHPGKHILTGVITKDHEDNVCRLQLWNAQQEKIYWLNADVCKLLLRPLSDLTEEECNKLDWAYRTEEGKKLNHEPTNLNPNEIIYLLSIGMDLFGLIEAGLAINKTL